MDHEFTYLGKIHKVEIETLPGSNKSEHYRVTVDGDKAYRVESISLLPHSVSFVVAGKIKTAYVTEAAGKKYIFVDGCYFVFEPEKSKTSRAAGAVVGEGGNTICSPMPGAVVKVLVSKGDKVEAGQTLAIVEAMKMENELKAPSGGVVKKINFSEGDQVDALQPIIELALS